MQDEPAPPTPFGQALFPVAFLLALVIYGLIIRPLGFGQAPIPLEVIFLMAASVTIISLVMRGHSWLAVQATIVNKIAAALPAFFILFSIGIVISSWIICGTIPMLVYYGIKLVNPDYLYLLAFLVPAVFSTMTGTSYGSAGTIGVVLIGVAQAVGADLGITAGAVIGGAYFGDKLSPLSDTTNLAALAADVDLFDHIRSMLYTTIPSALIACSVYLTVGLVSSVDFATADIADVDLLLDGLSSMFKFSVVLLLPPIVVLAGSIKRMPTVPTLLGSAAIASILAVLFQPFSPADLFQSLNKGFDASMAGWAGEVSNEVMVLVNRGGLYALIDAIVVAFAVFIYIGALDHIRAMPTVVDRVFRFAQTKTSTILASLVSSAFVNALTSNQYATSFIVGDAFKVKYDQKGVSRRVLSRSIEDYGTMIESIVPWTVTAVFMVATLGVPFADYWNWQILSLANIVVAPTIAILGIGCFYEKET